MPSWLKIAAAVAGALLVGSIGGYVLGSLGKANAESRAHRATSRLSSAQQALHEETAELKRVRTKMRGTRRVLLAKTDLLLALVELQSSNFGLASQHLGAARTHLERAKQAMSKGHKKTVEKLLSKISGAHTLTMKLDPMARLNIRRLIRAVGDLPGAR